MEVDCTHPILFRVKMSKTFWHFTRLATLIRQGEDLLFFIAVAK